MASRKSVVAALVALTLLHGARADLVPREANPPASCPGSPPYEYDGCYQNSGVDPALPFPSNLDTRDMTIEICTVFCKVNFYACAGIQNHGECWCGSSITAQKLDDTQCSYTCSADPFEKCGGDNILSVWKDPTIPDSSHISISDYELGGCWGQVDQGLTLLYQQSQLPATNMTIDVCLSACLDDGYPYAGLGFGQDCYCGVTLEHGAVSVPQNECTTPCTGNVSLMCGGSFVIIVYHAKALESTDPCSTAPVSPSSSVTTSALYTSTSSSPSTSTSPTSSSTTSPPLASASFTSSSTTNLPPSSTSSTSPSTTNLPPSSTSSASSSTTSPPPASASSASSSTTSPPPASASSASSSTTSLPPASASSASSSTTSLPPASASSASSSTTSPPPTSASWSFPLNALPTSTTSPNACTFLGGG